MGPIMSLPDSEQLLLGKSPMFYFILPLTGDVGIALHMPSFGGPIILTYVAVLVIYHTPESYNNPILMWYKSTYSYNEGAK